MWRRHAGWALVAILAAGAAVPVDTPFALLALVPLYFVARDGAALLGTGAYAAGVAAHWIAWGLQGGVAEAAAYGALAAGVVATARVRAERARGAERERVLVAERAAAEERLRIARELHDAVGHDVSLMVVQAQALGATAGDAAVREATDAIAEQGRRAMADLHRTLKALRAEDAERSPRPGLAALDEVLDGARAAGVPVTVAVEGAPRELAPALDASAFRILQEAVTNVVRHAGGAAARVVVTYGGDALDLRVVDEGGGSGNGRADGHGLIGMRERAAAFGGTLTAGHVDGRGFEIHATLPYA